MSFSYRASFVIVVLLIVGEFLCIKATSQTNVWTRRQNSTTITSDVVWLGPPTTPWPALGTRHSNTQLKTANSASGYKQSTQNENPGINQNVNVNRNIGVDLSYGLHTGSTTARPKANNVNRGVNSDNVGIALSYGTNFDRNKVQPNQGNALSASSQSRNIVNTSPHKATVTIRPDAQTTNSQGTNTNANNIKKPNNIIGSNLQPEKTAPITDEDEELREFSETLLRKDVNNAGKYVTVNYQGKTTSRSKNDEAPLPLLNIQKDAYNIPSIADLLLLHNNYILETNINEHVSAQEKMEENSLLDTILSTSVMQHTRNFLIQKGVITKDPKHFKDKLKEVWFNMYSRGKGKIGSSGFEHVFLAEIKNQDVSGLHNWVYFHDAEANRKANYLGYLKKLELGNNRGVILKFHFTLNGIDKPVGSMFIGTSPELEIALYSTCFLLRADQICPLRFDGKRFIIRTYTFRYRGKNMIGSAFPEI